MTKQWNPRLGAKAGAAIWACLLLSAGSAFPQVNAESPAISPAMPQTESPALQTQDQPQSDPITAPQAQPAPADPAAIAPVQTTPVQTTPAQTAPQPSAAEATPPSPQPAPATTPDSAPAPLSSSSAELPVGGSSPLEITQNDNDPALPHDLSPKGMFLAADWVVKAVMIGLAFASVVTWTVLIVRLIALWLASARVNRACRRIETAADLSAAVAASAGKRDPASAMISSAMQEYERSLPSLQGRSGDEGLKDRVASHVMQIEAQASRRISRGTGLLATIGSTAPFVGLFGTVWGIMNSFIGISQSQTTSLSVVAPGIAEALLATAMGLVAAIPAVVFYNVFARAITGYRLKLAAAGAGVQRLVSRDLDFRGI